jgi:V-type H+-transporting ATPase subunit a
MSTAEINEMVVDPVSGQSEEKCVFMIFAHGKEVLKKVRKIAESMSATLYQVDEDLDKRRQASLEVSTKIQDLNNVKVKKIQQAILLIKI